MRPDAAGAGRRREPRLPGDAAVAAMLAAGSFLLYLATLSGWYSADSLHFALKVDTASLVERVDAHHLLLNPIATAWVALWRGLGWTGPSIGALEVLNALAGALSVAFVHRIAFRACGSRVAAALAAAGCAVAGGLWLFSTEAEDATLGLAPHLAVLSFLVGPEAARPRSSRRAAAIGMAIGVATAIYALAFLLIAVAALALWQGRNSNPCWRRHLAWVAAGLAAVVVPCGALVLWLQSGSGWGGLRAAYLGYGGLGWENAPRGLYAYLRTFVLFPGLGINDSTERMLSSGAAGLRIAFAATYALTALFVTVPLLLLWRHRTRWEGEWRLRLGAWAALHAAFAFWWVPSDLEFWLPVAVAWWIAFAVVLQQGLVRPSVAAVAIAVIAAVNGGGLIRQHRDASGNVHLQAALQVGGQASARDALVTSPPLHLLVRYFVGRESFRVDREGGLEAAVERARAAAERDGGRVLAVDVAFDASQRARWRAARLADVGGVEVWELRPRAAD